MLGYICLNLGKDSFISKRIFLIKKEIFSTGIFLESEELNNFIIAPIELAQELLNLPKNSAYQVVIKLNNTSQTEEIRRQIYQQIGNKDYLIKTKSEENTAFWKMINTEKLMVYIIFGLVIFITTFNLAGAITILQLDKKQQTKTLISLGVSHQRNKKNILLHGDTYRFFWSDIRVKYRKYNLLYTTSNRYF